MKPKISVLVPIYNAAEFLAETIQSILDQTFSDFELILVDDSSTDNSKAIAESFAAHDSRILLTHNKYHKGIVGALNTAIELAQGEFWARMDSDDICRPERFAKQVEFLEQNPEIVVAGSWVQTFGAFEAIWKYPEDPDESAVLTLLQPPVAHPSVMLRAQFFRENGLRYEFEFDKCEDYDLWERVLKAGGKIASIPEVLLDYRVSANSITNLHKDKNAILSDQIRARMFADRGINLEPNEIDLYAKLINRAVSTVGEIKDLKTLIKKIYSKLPLSEKNIWLNLSMERFVDVCINSRVFNSLRFVATSGVMLAFKLRLLKRYTFAQLQ